MEAHGSRTCPRLGAWCLARGQPGPVETAFAADWWSAREDVDGPPDEGVQPDGRRGPRWVIPAGFNSASLSGPMPQVPLMKNLNDRRTTETRRSALEAAQRSDVADCQARKDLTLDQPHARPTPPPCKPTRKTAAGGRFRRADVLRAVHGDAQKHGFVKKVSLPSIQRDCSSMSALGGVDRSTRTRSRSRCLMVTGGRPRRHLRATRMFIVRGGRGSEFSARNRGSLRMTTTLWTFRAFQGASAAGHDAGHRRLLSTSSPRAFPHQPGAGFGDSGLGRGRERHWHVAIGPRASSVASHPAGWSGRAIFFIQSRSQWGRVAVSCSATPESRRGRKNSRKWGQRLSLAIAAIHIG